MKLRFALGLRDSGVGGLTVARELKRQIPTAQLLYFADTAHVPYGDKTPAQIRHYALSISQFLIQNGASAVVFACNTTSALALESARRQFPQTPIWGVIEPGARASCAVSRGKIGVLATSATVQSGVYTREIQKLRPDFEVFEIACPAFVPLVEARQQASVEAMEACKHYLAPLLRAGADTVVLGCTHFPLLLPLLQSVAPEIHFVDPAFFLAHQIRGQFAADLIVHQKNTPPPRFWVSGQKTGVDGWVKSLLDIENFVLEDGPVFNVP